MACVSFRTLAVTNASSNGAAVCRKMHEAGSETSLVPLTTTRVPPLIGPPRGVTVEMAILRELNTRSASRAWVYVAPSAVTARASSPARAISGVMQVIGGSVRLALALNGDHAASVRPRGAVGWVLMLGW